jgi:hypothetical protein
VNHPAVVAEVVEGEVILINLETGTYYSLSGSGAAIWALLDGHRSRDQILAAAEERFEGDAAAIRESVDGLIEQLLAEELVSRADEPAAAATTNGGAPARTPFQPPALGKYTDMQEFLLLDPIHDISEAGWPQPASG